jgi:hypothetical protein
MSLNHRQRRELRRIESRLLRSDPHLAAMLAVFGRLVADQRMPVREQEASRPDRLRQAAFLLARAIAVTVAAVGFLVSSVIILVTGSRRRPPQPTSQHISQENSDL